MMSSLPPVNDVKAAIGSLDEKVLSREQLEKVRAHLPTAEEMDMIKAMDGPDVRWDKPEQFLKALMAIPKLTVRLRCWSIKYGFSERAAEITETLSTLQGAVDALRQSTALPVVLGLLVNLGNHLNGGTPKGQADGFALADLAKMSVTKDAANKATLLEYALAVLGGHEDYEHGLKLPEELALLREAKVKLGDIKASLHKLGGEARELAAQARAEDSAAADAAPSSGAAVARGGADAANDPFSRTMARFSEQAAAQMAELTSRLDDVEGSYARLLAWLRDKPKGGKPTETDALFALFVEFGDAVKAAAPKPAPIPRSATGKTWKLDDGSESSTRNAEPAAEPKVASSKPLSPKPAEMAASLDPMMSRLTRLSTAAPNNPSRLSTANALGSGQLQPRGGGVRPPPKARDREADQRLQERMAARLERAQGRLANAK